MIKEIFGKKLGMTQIFDTEGNLIPVSLVEVEPVCVLEKKEYNGRKAARIGYCKVAENRVNRISKPHLGYFKKLEVNPYQFTAEVATEGDIELKKEFGLEIFNEGDIVDVRALTKGKGFAGGMKKHHWSGQPSAHGHTSHRRIGSNGSNTDPGRVVRGHRMPGHMGDVYRTTKNLKVVKLDNDKKLIFIQGSTPGAIGKIVKIIKVKSAKPATETAEKK